MSKQKKKRNKAYTGVDAAVSRPTITRVSASNRSKPAQWLYERRQFMRPAITTLIVIAIASLVIIGLIQLFQ